MLNLLWNSGHTNTGQRDDDERPMPSSLTGCGHHLFVVRVVRAPVRRGPPGGVCCFRVKQRSLLLLHLDTIPLHPCGHPVTSNLPKPLYLHPTFVTGYVVKAVPTLNCIGRPEQRMIPSQACPALVALHLVPPSKTSVPTHSHALKCICG